MRCLGVAGHSVLPNLRASMRDKRGFPLSVGLMFSLVSVLYTASGLLGVSMFGTDVAEQITLSLDHSASRLGLAANVLVMLNPLTSYALYMHPVACGERPIQPLCD